MGNHGPDFAWFRIKTHLLPTWSVCISSIFLVKFRANIPSNQSGFSTCYETILCWGPESQFVAPTGSSLVEYGCRPLSPFPVPIFRSQGTFPPHALQRWWHPLSLRCPCGTGSSHSLVCAEQSHGESWKALQMVKKLHPVSLKGKPFKFLFLGLLSLVLFAKNRGASLVYHLS